MGAYDLPQRLRHRKRDHKVLHWQQLSHPLGQPKPDFVVLAVGTMSVAAASTDPMLVWAGFALVLQMSQLARSTTGNQSQHAFVLMWHSMTELGQISVRMLPQSFCDRWHQLSGELVKQATRLSDLI